MEMYIAGRWCAGSKKTEVIHPFDGRVLDSVPQAGPDDVEQALAAAVRGAAAMARLSAYERYEILRRAATAIEAHQEEMARTITLEEGKILAEARAEVARAVQTLTIAAEEAKRLYGETIPLDAAPGVQGKLGLTWRVPCGVVVAVSPFNFPLNLMAHKVAPAIAAGNAVILKPPSSTPLSALTLTRLLLESGLPPEGIACITGPGAEVGEALCRDPRVRKVSFTGSVPVGEQICRAAGIKKVTMELGGNAPLVVLADADLERAATAIAATGYGNAGQVCISAQRVIAGREIYEDLIALTKAKVASLTAGDPSDAATKVGPLVREAEAIRVQGWIAEAVGAKARLVIGNERQGAVLSPTIVADVTPEMRLAKDELFGPAVAFMPAASPAEALALANRSRFGLAASVFTRDVDKALRMAQGLEAGSVHVNYGPQWRADLMPYGGFKDSGFGKEGPRYAVLEMTELKMVVLHLE
ncbi:MAG: aldehyde dehydrogenase family protein [Deltaproteobacteria bacterium]|nr:aldehyde dehydrogenase family protein [Deltaproteobacteria bacterium]